MGSPRVHPNRNGRLTKASRNRKLRTIRTEIVCRLGRHGLMVVGPNKCLMHRIARGPLPPYLLSGIPTQFTYVRSPRVNDRSIECNATVAMVETLFPQLPPPSPSYRPKMEKTSQPMIACCPLWNTQRQKDPKIVAEI
jgi:hypothetical protein